jgi:thiamine-phosphate pyrophosphorylase
VKTLYVTDRAAITESAWSRILDDLRGAASLSVQLRERELSDRAYCDLARDAKARLGPDVPLLINSRFDVALAAGADGVQLPADGLPLDRVKAATPRGFRVGISTHSPAEAVRAVETRADIVLIGPIFDTPSKRAFGSPLGPSALAGLPRASEHQSEVYAIGGVNEDTLGQLMLYRDRISGVAAIRMIQEATQPRAVAERLAAL